MCVNFLLKSSKVVRFVRNLSVILVILRNTCIFTTHTCHISALYVKPHSVNPVHSRSTYVLISTNSHTDVIPVTAHSEILVTLNIMCAFKRLRQRIKVWNLQVNFVCLASSRNTCDSALVKYCLTVRFATKNLIGRTILLNMCANITCVKSNTNAAFVMKRTKMLIRFRYT